MLSAVTGFRFHLIYVLKGNIKKKWCAFYHNTCTVKFVPLKYRGILCFRPFSEVDLLFVVFIQSHDFVMSFSVASKYSNVIKQYIICALNDVQAEERGLVIIV